MLPHSSTFFLHFNRSSLRLFLCSPNKQLHIRLTVIVEQLNSSLDRSVGDFNCTFQVEKKAQSVCISHVVNHRHRWIPRKTTTTKAKWEKMTIVHAADGTPSSIRSFLFCFPNFCSEFSPAKQWNIHQFHSTMPHDVIEKCSSLFGTKEKNSIFSASQTSVACVYVEICPDDGVDYDNKTQ